MTNPQMKTVEWDGKTFPVYLRANGCFIECVVEFMEDVIDRLQDDPGALASLHYSTCREQSSLKILGTEDVIDDDAFEGASDHVNASCMDAINEFIAKQLDYVGPTYFPNDDRISVKSLKAAIDASQSVVIEPPSL